MGKYSEKSQKKLNTCHPDLIRVFELVIPFFDHSILYGHRSATLQKELYKKGRELIEGEWVKTGKTVTNCDGVNKKSKHQGKPSMAVDAVPYPINWKDVDRMRYFAGMVVMAGRLLYESGENTHLVRWGGDWDKDTRLDDQRFNDLPHFELYQLNNVL